MAGLKIYRLFSYDLSSITFSRCCLEVLAQAGRKTFARITVSLDIADVDSNLLTTEYTCSNFASTCGFL